MKAVILAGGLGTRLKPFTQAIPKPLLPIGESTVLETQIHNLAKHGFKEIYIATNYKADYIVSFLGDGSRFGVNLYYSKEGMPLGTCGPLSLLRDKLTTPFLVINGDILTLMNFRDFYDTASSKESFLTVATVHLRTPFNFGRVVTENDEIVQIDEKPDLVTEILAGIYFMKPEILEYIPPNTFFGIDTLLFDMLRDKTTISRYLMKEYWLDIGRIDDYTEAQLAYERHFKKLSE